MSKIFKTLKVHINITRYMIVRIVLTARGSIAVERTVLVWIEILPVKAEWV